MTFVAKEKNITIIMNLLYLPYRLFDNAITRMGKEHLKTKILGTVIILVAYNSLIIFTIMEFNY